MKKKKDIKIVTPDFIRKILEDSGLSLAEFSVVLGVTGAAVHNWRSGASVPSRLHKTVIMLLNNKIEDLKSFFTQEEIKELIIYRHSDYGMVNFLTWLVTNEVEPIN